MTPHDDDPNTESNTTGSHEESVKQNVSRREVIRHVASLGIVSITAAWLADKANASPRGITRGLAGQPAAADAAAACLCTSCDCAGQCDCSGGCPLCGCLTECACDVEEETASVTAQSTATESLGNSNTLLRADIVAETNNIKDYAQEAVHDLDESEGRLARRTFSAKSRWVAGTGPGFPSKLV